MKDTLTPNKGLDARTALAEKINGLFPKGCRRILLVNPVQIAVEDFDIGVAQDNRYPVYPPYGLGILSTVLKERGYETGLIDLNFMLQESLKTAPSTFKFNLWEHWLAERIEQFNPDIIATSCMFTVTYRQMKKTADFIKQCRPSLPIIAGGVHSTQAVDMVLADSKSIDLISLYEGNESFPALIDFINKKAPVENLAQLAAQIDGKFFALKDRAEKMPATTNIRPDYHDLPMGKYSPFHGRIGTYYWLWPEGASASTVLSNVGCRAQCTFCSVRSFNGVGVMGRDVKNVVDELEHLKEKYGITHIMWLDDDLLYNEKRAIELFNEMTKRKLGITWDATNGIIASAVTPEIAAAAAESGCIGLSLGIESGNADILKSVKKPSTVQHFHRASEILHKYPQIFLKGLLMCGFPKETIAMQLDTVKLAMDIQLDWCTIQPLNFIPGVEITNHALVSGVVDKQSLMDGTERPFVGSTGGQIRREKNETVAAEQFTNLLEGDPNRIPSRNEIKDIWFIMDYKVNYERLWGLHSEIKLKMLLKLFINICDKTHHVNALGNLYFGLINHRLGYDDEAKDRLALARKYSSNNDYWKKRFEALKLNDVLNEIESQCNKKAS